MPIAVLKHTKNWLSMADLSRPHEYPAKNRHGAHRECMPKSLGKKIFSVNKVKSIAQNDTTERFSHAHLNKRRKRIEQVRPLRSFPALKLTGAVDELGHMKISKSSLL